jgi:hypothetical protein
MARVKPQAPQPQQARPIPSIWVKGKDNKGKEDIEYILRNNKILIEAFLNALNQMEEEELRSERDINQYETASWSHKQADRNGAIRFSHKVKQLFNFLES